jgi:sialate O-acetylesterase
MRVPAIEQFGPARVIVVGKNAIEFKDVLIGDVWLCAGQSNMEWSIENCGNPQPELAAANYPEMRFVQIPKVASTVPLDDSRNPWLTVTPENVAGPSREGGKFGQGGLSAVGYYFGRELHRKLNRPIGLIHCSWSGTICEAWASDAALRNDGEYAALLARAAKANDDPNQSGEPNRASVLFNGMLAPIKTYRLKGAIWYQGESNAARAYQYRKLFPAMIADWRKQWDQGDFPFLYVQLAGFMPRLNDPGESMWAELREAQQLSLAVPHTGMASAVDLGDAIDIHPKNKQDVGKRLAISAMDQAYGRNVVASGPLYRAMTVEGDKIRVQFHHVAGGLRFRGLKPTGLAICDENRKFIWATAKIDGDSLLVWSDDIKQPVAVRYAWADNPAGNLYNSADLPASPFRTDDFPGITVNVK